MAELAGAVLVSVGVAFFAAGSIGLLRLPTLHARLHALTKADNLGLGFVVAGLVVLEARLAAAAMLVLVWLVVLAGSALVSHLIARDALPESDE